METVTLGELLGLSPEELAQELKMPLQAAQRLWREKVYPENIPLPALGHETLDAFDWGFAVGTWCERHKVKDAARLAVLLQHRLGRVWVCL